MWRSISLRIQIVDFQTANMFFLSSIFKKICHYRTILWPNQRTKPHKRPRGLQQPSFLPNNGAQLLRCSYYADRRVNLSTQMLTLLARLLVCLRGNNVARKAQSQLAKREIMMRIIMVMVITMIIMLTMVMTEGDSV